MKLQFTPLSLCFLLTLFAFGNPVFAINKAATNNLVFPLNKESNTVNTNIDPFEKTSDSNSEISSEKNSTEVVFPQDWDSATKDDFLFFEENSYKKENVKSENSENISENSASLLLDVLSEKKSFFIQGLYYGFALMVILLNLVSYFLFDEKTFLYFSLALAGSILTLFYSEGLFSVLGIDLIPDGPMVTSVLLFIAVGFNALFANRYLNLKEFAPKLKWFSLPLLAIAPVFIFAAWLFDNPAFAYIANITLLYVLASYYVGGILLFKRKNYAKLYVVACGIPLVIVLDFFVLKNFGFNFLTNHPLQLKIAVFFEMFLITYAIMFRMKSIKEEGELRQTEMRIFLKRQEAMNRQNAVKMMEEVYLENLIMQYDLDGLEIKLLQYISEGKENVKIARKLNTTEADVEELTKELYNKLEISEHIQEDFRIVNAQPDYIYN